jgi:hypothetical protein
MIENEESQKKMKFIKWSEIDNNELFSFYSEIKLKKVNNFL